MSTITERGDLGKRMPTNDIFHTSTGVGHHWRPGYYFPDSTFQSVLREPLPPELVKPNEIVPGEHFKTTTGTVHDPKYSNGPLQQAPLFKRAPGHWNMHYLQDIQENRPKRGWRRPLSPSHQQSETHEEFRNRPGLSEPWQPLSVQPFNLHNHHIDGPSKQMVSSTQNSKLAGRTLYPKDQEVLRNLDPYLTSNMKYHRVWNPTELQGYPKKDIATYWDCEEYPKAWGFGLKTNPLPKSSVPREQPPMRDTVIFKSAATVRRVPPALVPVPHTGLNTLYGDSYQIPSNVKAKEANICPVETPFLLPDPGPKATFAVPSMYATEYQNHGKRYPTVIS